MKANMNRGKKYHTKQQQIIINYLKDCRDEYIQINELLQKLKLNDIHIGIATVYRNLDKLVDAGLVRKISVEGISGACYQYIQDEKTDGFCMKCEKCNQIMDTECNHISELYNHIMEEHGFAINPNKTIFYGICEKCKQRSSNEVSQIKS